MASNRMRLASIDAAGPLEQDLCTVHPPCQRRLAVARAGAPEGLMTTYHVGGLPSVVTLVMAPADLAAFAPTLQRGVTVQAAGQASVASFLVDGLGIDPEYVRQRVTTVFLDGAVVDDLELAHLR